MIVNRLPPSYQKFSGPDLILAARLLAIRTSAHGLPRSGQTWCEECPTVIPGDKTLCADHAAEADADYFGSLTQDDLDDANRAHMDEGRAFWGLS
jgi:hypothetical protein